MRKVLLLLLLCSLATSYAQKGGLKGRVLDETKQPLPGATVTISENEIGTSTDFNGNYELLNISNGTYKIEISFIGYGTTTEKVTISNGITTKNFSLKPKANTLDEVIVQGSIRKGQAKALNKQKSNDNITNVISSDQVGKFPDANIGDALKRVPGIAMQNDQGEARNIIIRGLAPQLNSVTLNGDRIPSAEGNNRRVQMDLIPSDMIQTVEVSKAVTPDMEADAIGGSVNLITRSAPSIFRASITGSYGTNPVRKNGNTYTISGLVAGRTKDKKLGAVLNASYNSNNYGSDNVEFEWKSNNIIQEHDIRKYDVHRIRKSVGFNIDWKPDPNHTLEFKSIYNERDDRENRYRLRYKLKKGKYKITRQTKGGINNDDNKNRRLERQTTYKLGIGGEHIILSNVKIDWKLSTSKAKEERPNERYITFEADEKVSGEDILAEDIRKFALNTEKPYFRDKEGLNIENNPTLFKLDEVSEENRFTQEKKISSRLNVKIPLTTEGAYQNYIKTGYKYKYKEKERNNNFYEFDKNNFSQYNLLSTTPNSNQTLNNFLAGSQYQSGIFATNELLGNLNLTNGKLIKEEFVPINYNANEDIYAFYAMLKQHLGEQFSLITGLRAESTHIDYAGFRYIAKLTEEYNDPVTGEEKERTVLEEQINPTSGSKSYTNWLPNIQLKYTPNKNIVVRGAWTNTIARPNYFDLVPYENVISEDNEVELGNPNLKAATSMNFDVMGEYYFANVGLISLGGFYKNITDFIYEKSENEERTYQDKRDDYQVKRIFNGGTAKVYGVEFSIQHKLNFLPSFLRNVTFYGNYTYTDSKTTGINGREEGLDLAGAIKHMANTSLAYETNKFTLRGSVNFASDYIDEYGKESFEDSYYDQQTFVDVNLSYKFYKGFRIFAEGKNLTNQPLRYYQGVKNQTKQAEYYNYNWNVGVKYNF